MNISRRTFVISALGATAVAVAGGVALAAPGNPRGNGRYAPVRKLPGGGPAPQNAPGHDHGPAGRTGDMIEQLPNGRWTSHLLPFATEFPDKASLQAELARSRAMGLIR